MFNFRAFSIVLPFLFVSVFICYNANAQTYLPVGPQTNVPVDTVTGGGWTECYRDRYSNHLDTNAVLALCPGDRLLLSCRPTGSSTLALLAQGDRSDVTFDTGVNQDVTHIANGVGWYFNDFYSWGFVRAGDAVSKVSCDTENSNADERLCWHTSDDGGWRCGVTTGLNDSVDFERIVYTSSPFPHQRAIPTLSEWGMITVAAGLGLIGVFFAARKRLRTSEQSDPIS
jgi:hypothetical protein